jgi:NTP pyrophosphatase (non-canonical NTP hydrolase)
MLAETRVEELLAIGPQWQLPAVAVRWQPQRDATSVDLEHFQHVIEATFGERDRARGVPSSVAWIAEEVGELAQAVRKGSTADQVHEFADVLAWVASLANQLGIDLSAAIERYADGCPRCGSMPCRCA